MSTHKGVDGPSSGKQPEILTSVNGSNGAFRAQPNMNFEPPKAEDLQASYAHVIAADTGKHNWYEKMRTSIPLIHRPSCSGPSSSVVERGCSGGLLCAASRTC